MRAIFALLGAALTLGGCTTMTTPVLRHETGETLGRGNFRATARFESSRMYGFTEGDASIDRIAQNSDVFTGSLFGASIAAGLTDRIDLNAMGLVNFSGAGWHFGGKARVFRRGRYAISVLGGYGVNSGNGSVTYLTAGFPVTLNQTLSAHVYDLGVPASIRLGDVVTAYGGLTWFHAGVTGTVGANAVSAVTNDVGANLGLRFDILSRFELDAETAVLRFYDPFADEMRYVPYFGLAASILF